MGKFSDLRIPPLFIFVILVIIMTIAALSTMVIQEYFENIALKKEITIITAPSAAPSVVSVIIVDDDDLNSNVTITKEDSNSSLTKTNGTDENSESKGDTEVANTDSEAPPTETVEEGSDNDGGGVGSTSETSNLDSEGSAVTNNNTEGFENTGVEDSTQILPTPTGNTTENEDTEGTTNITGSEIPKANNTVEEMA